jgi:hypothetical protein
MIWKHYASLFYFKPKKLLRLLSGLDCKNKTILNGFDCQKKPLGGHQEVLVEKKN